MLATIPKLELVNPHLGLGLQSLNSIWGVQRYWCELPLPRPLFIFIAVSHQVYPLKHMALQLTIKESIFI